MSCGRLSCIKVQPNFPRLNPILSLPDPNSSLLRQHPRAERAWENCFGRMRDGTGKLIPSGEGLLANTKHIANSKLLQLRCGKLMVVQLHVCASRTSNPPATDNQDARSFAHPSTSGSRSKPENWTSIVDTPSVPRRVDEHGATRTIKASEFTDRSAAST